MGGNPSATVAAPTNWRRVGWIVLNKLRRISVN
jgi:hypothetical protein